MKLGRIAFVVVAVLAFAIDRITKLLVEANLAVGDRVELIGTLLQLRHVHNRGIAFGMFSGAGSLVLVGTLLVGVLLFVFLMRVHPEDHVTIMGGALVTGGALGNLYDRVEYRYVIDFIGVPRFPTFNVADVWITCGVALIVLGQLLEMQRERAAARLDEPVAKSGERP